MNPYGPAVNDLIDQFATLPGIGRKSAERLANHILMCSREDAAAFVNAIRKVKETVRPCSQCYNLSEQETCAICSDQRRDQAVICIVEQPKDVILLEGSSVFQGVYHVLQGRIAPLEGVGPEDLTIEPLMRRVRRNGVREIIMATNPTLEGDGTALYLSNLLAGETGPDGQNIRITRLARGIPSGSVLEFANKEMLADALKGRQSF